MMAPYGADELLCHHGDDEHGHPLGSDCPVQVKRGDHGWPQIDVCGRPHHFLWPALRRLYGHPQGTCPECGRTGVKVANRTVLGNHPNHFPNLPLGERPELAAHKRPERGGKACPGAGRVPAETRFSHFAIDAWLRDYGQQHMT